MARGHDYQEGPNQELFIGGEARLRPQEDLTEAEAEGIREEAIRLGFRQVKVRQTKDLSGRVRGYAVEMKPPGGGKKPWLMVGTRQNWQEHKRKLLANLGLVLP